MGGGGEARGLVGYRGEGVWWAIGQMLANERPQKKLNSKGTTYKHMDIALV